MAEGFVPIETEEEFQKRVDSIVKGRLERQERSFQDKYAEVFSKAKQFDEAAERDKTDLQKALERATEAESKAARLEEEAQKRTWADEVSQETGVPARLIRGASKEEMTTYAKELSDYAEGLKPAPPVVASEGHRPSSAAQLSNAELFAQMLEG